MTTIRTRSKSLRTRRWLAAATGVLLLQSVGCGMSHGNRGGDPVLGSFNRPVTPSPSPTGPNIGGPMEGPGVYAPPGVAADQLRPNEFPTLQLGGTPVNTAMPGYTNAPYTTSSSGLGKAFSVGGESMTRRLPSGVRGATLLPPATSISAMTGTPAMQPGNYPGGAMTPAVPIHTPTRAMPVYPGSNSSPVPTSGLPLTYQGPPANSVEFRPTTAITSGAALVPAVGQSWQTASGVSPVGYSVDPRRDARGLTVEDSQQILRSNGMRWMQLEQIEGGEWYFACSRGATSDGNTHPKYEARRPQAIDAVRSVIQQVAAEIQAGR